MNKLKNIPNPHKTRPMGKETLKAMNRENSK